jgi:farnesyl diphosphate synthase
VATDSALRGFLEQCQRRVEAALEQRLPPATVPPTRLHEAMRYAVLGAGKRVRPVLVYAAGGALGVPPESLDDAACAVELVHAYSLVHDDLPAMDDDDLRRGRPTCHRAYDEATAILVGDALQTLAFQVLCDEPTDGAAAATRLAMVRTLAAASGSRGMAGGQSLDLDAVGRELTLAELEQLHIHKTGALIRASVRLGTLAAPTADPAAVRRLDRYGKCIGLAFQIRDDILDVEGDPALIGKTRGKDAAHDKPTYPALLGLAGARDKCAVLLAEATSCLDGLGEDAQPLHWLAEYIVARSH